MTKASGSGISMVTGKIGSAEFERHVLDFTGARRRDVLAGPKFGLDFGLIGMGGQRVMAVSTDPIWVDRVYGLKRASWFAFHTIVGDVAVSGLSPAYLAVDWNLPAISPRELDAMFGVFDSEARRLGMAIVAGHTGVYEGASFPTIGGGTAIAVGKKSQVKSPSGTRRGDVLVITKGPAIETAVALCYRFREFMEGLIGTAAVRKVRSMFYSMSVVDDAIAGSAIEGLTSMHDASERGIAAALNELSLASGRAIEFEPEAVFMKEEISSICSAMRLDAYSCSSEGALLITVESGSVDELLGRLKKKGTDAYVAGKVLDRGTGVFCNRDGRRKTLVPPARDHMLKAFRTAAAKAGAGNAKRRN